MIKTIIKKLITGSYAFLALTFSLEVVVMAAHLYLGNTEMVAALQLAMAWTLTQIIFVKVLNNRIA